MTGRMTVRSFASSAAILVLMVVTAVMVSCVGKTPLPVRAGELRPSPKLNPFIHFEEGNVMFLGVDGRAAQYIKDGEIFPLGLGITNNHGTPLTFRREKIILEDDKGMRYPLVSVEEFNKNYERSRMDARLADSLLGVMKGRYGQYPSVSWRLFPYKGESSTTTDRLELGRNFWTVTYLYFPVPEGGLHDRLFSLLVNVDEMDETFTVRFFLK